MPSALAAHFPLARLCLHHCLDSLDLSGSSYAVPLVHAPGCDAAGCVSAGGEAAGAASSAAWQGHPL